MLFKRGSKKPNTNNRPQGVINSPMGKPAKPNAPKPPVQPNRPQAKAPKPGQTPPAKPNKPQANPQKPPVQPSKPQPNGLKRGVQPNKPQPNIQKPGNPLKTPAQNTKRKKFHRGNYTLYYVLAGIILVIAFVILANTVLFKCASINVSGNDNYDSDEIILASGINIGDNLVQLKTGKAEESIVNSLAYIDAAKVKKSFPTKINITVTEAEKQYCVAADGKTAAISRRGKIVELCEPNGLPVVKGYEPETLEVGTWLKSRTDGKSDIPAEVFSAAEKAGLKNITVVDVSDKFNIEVTVEDRVVLKLGMCEDVVGKLLVAVEIIENQLGETEYVTLQLNNPEKVPVQNNSNPNKPASSSSSKSPTPASSASSDTEQPAAPEEPEEPETPEEPEEPEYPEYPEEPDPEEPELW